MWPISTTKLVTDHSHVHVPLALLRSSVLCGYHVTTVDFCPALCKCFVPNCSPTGATCTHTAQKLIANLSVAELLRREQQDVSAVHTSHYADHTQFPFPSEGFVVHACVVCYACIC